MDRVYEDQFEADMAGRYEAQFSAPEPYQFVRTEYCTPHCGKSTFADWAHTPKCEKANMQAQGYCEWCGWDETDSWPHREDCGR